jgi:hypothetical protein
MTEKFDEFPASAVEGINRGIKAVAEQMGITEAEVRERMKRGQSEEEIDQFFEELNKIINKK